MQKSHKTPDIASSPFDTKRNTYAAEATNIPTTIDKIMNETKVNILELPSEPTSITEAEIPEVALLIQKTIASYPEYSEKELHKLGRTKRLAKEEELKRMLAGRTTEQLIEDLAKKQETYVLKRKNKIVGTISIGKGESTIHGTKVSRNNILMSLFVDPDMHGMGFGGKLVRFIEKKARENGAKYMLVPSRNNSTTIAIYKALGYEVAEETVAMTELEKNLLKEKIVTYESEEGRQLFEFLKDGKKNTGVVRMWKQL